MAGPNLADLLDRPIAFHRAFVRLGVGVTGALMLSQAIYWSRRTSDVDGWFFKTQSDWEDETGLSRCEQETARNKLKAAGVLKEVRRGVPARLFYRVDFDALRHLTAEDLPQTSMRETSNLDCGKPADKIEGFPQSLKEETTSETTTEIISTRATANGRPSEAPEPRSAPLNEASEPSCKSTGTSFPAVPSSKPCDPREELLSVLDAAHADAVIEHRRRIRKPMTGHAAKLLAAKFRQCRDPNAAADAMIVNGWQGFEPAWLERQAQAPVRADRPRNVVDAARARLLELQGRPADGT